MVKYLKQISRIYCCKLITDMIKKEENNAVVRQYDVETLSLELTRKKQEYNDIMSGVSTGTTKDTKVNMPLPARKADADEQ